MTNLSVQKICVAVFLPLLAACRSEEYFPLRDGLEWEYEMGATRFTSRVDGSRDVEGKTYFRVVSGMPGSGDVFLRRSGDSVFIRGSRSEMLYLGPLEVGSTWRTIDSYGEVEIGVVEVRESVSAGGKTYTDCLRVRRTIEGLRESVEHYCEGVGMVRHSDGHIRLVRFSSRGGSANRRTSVAEAGAARGDNTLSHVAAQQALAAWAAQQGGGNIELVGVREVPSENQALANIRMVSVPYRDQIFGNTKETQRSVISRAQFTRYNDRGWVLSRVVYGEHGEMVWDTDLPVFGR
jgi:hypothetical protein